MRVRAQRSTTEQVAVICALGMDIAYRPSAPKCCRSPGASHMVFRWPRWFSWRRALCTSRHRLSRSRLLRDHTYSNGFHCPCCGLCRRQAPLSISQTTTFVHFLPGFGPTWLRLETLAPSERAHLSCVGARPLLDIGAHLARDGRGQKALDVNPEV